MGKKDLTQILKPNPKSEPTSPIKVGRGYQLSVDEEKETVSAQGHMGTEAQRHMGTASKKKKAPPTRGFRISEKNVKELKVIAANESRAFWMVLNEAVEEYIARKSAKKA